MTDPRPTDDANRADAETANGTGRATMRDVSHTPPYDDALTGVLMFSRGLEVATDGGTPQAPADPAERGRATMADVDHTPPDGDGARKVWDRGLPKPGVHVAGGR